MSDTISLATLDFNSADIADAGRGPHQQAIDEPHAVTEYADFAANGKASRSRSDVLEKAIETQCRMLQKSREIIRGLDHQVMSDLAVIDRKNRALYEKDTELLRLTKRLKKEEHEATVSDLLLNDVATELAHQHQKLKFAVYHANLFQDRQKLLLSLLEESLRHGQEPIQAVINNWKPICIGTDRISDLSLDGAAVAQLLRIVDARNEERPLEIDQRVANQVRPVDNTIGRI